MPLVDSGTALFAGSAAEFVRMAPEGRPRESSCSRVPPAAREHRRIRTACVAQQPHCTRIGSRRRVDRLHPSVQASAYADYLRESHSAFTEHGYRLSACAYLHNMHRLRSHLIRGTVYHGYIQTAPLFTAGDEAGLSEFLTDRVSGGDGLPLLEKLVHGASAHPRNCWIIWRARSRKRPLGRFLMSSARHITSCGV